MTRYFEIRPQLKKYFANEGTFTDPRDGNVYKTVEIGGQTWLAENLRYEGVRHFAPNGDKDNIAEYGCLYTWEDALAACPDGWHLPSKEEFVKLLKVAGSINNTEEQFNNLSAQKWDGDDKFGFKALPAGFCEDKNSHIFGGGAYFWSSTHFYDVHYESDCVWFLDMESNSLTDKNYPVAFINYAPYDVAYSVRCIKD